MKYWGSTNKVKFDFGPFSSRKEAIGAVIASRKEVPGRIYTGEQLDIKVSIDVPSLLEGIRRNFGLEPDWALLHDEAEQDLSTKLNKVLLTWLKNWDVEAQLIAIDKIVAHDLGRDL